MRLRRGRGEGPREVATSSTSSSSTHTNDRTDKWPARTRPDALRVEIVSRDARAVGRDFIIILPPVDARPDSRREQLPEAVTLARAITAAGATIINTGHRLARGLACHDRHQVARRRLRVWARRRCPMRYRGAACIDSRWSPATRINTPEVAEQLLADGYRDIVSLCAPLLGSTGTCRLKRRRVPPRYITPCIALPTKPAWTTPSKKRARHLPGQPACRARDRTRDDARVGSASAMQ